MHNIQDTLLFPVRDAEARKQFLIACAIMLAAFIIPILPTLVVMGYSAKIMREIIEERKSPSMPIWQSGNLSDMLLDGLRLYGAQLVLMLPLFILLGCGMISMFGGSIGFAAITEENGEAFGAVGMLFLMLGMAIIMLFSILSLPYGIVVAAALPHVAIKRSFQAAFEFKEWFSIFRKALGPFIIGYAVIMLVSFLFMLVMQVAMMTIVLMCIVPLIMVPYMAYQVLVMNALFAQAYLTGSDGLQAA